ncbi:hypothetical protein [Klebsiella pneumoniae]|uniref:hypothetical protein n=1 Tax=Klebsiella pneumoniae TaxID=573 RepID=UPI002380E210|nr:hypothetical protein [Klebsiella pneumoniae]MDE4745169.1 hypothetical protein [Klebsiella pneumoniae]
MTSEDVLKVLANEEINREELESESVAHGIVNLNSKLMLEVDEKKSYQSADIVKHIIEYDSSIKWSVESILNGVEKSENKGYASAELSELKEVTEQYIKRLENIQERVNLKCYDLAQKTLLEHGIKLDVESDFEVDGYRFKATPVSNKINFIVADLFSPSDIANINMTLGNVTVTGDKKIRKTQLPTRLILNLWPNK